MRMKKSLYGITMGMVLCCSAPTLAFADDTVGILSEVKPDITAAQENTENSYGTEGQEKLPVIGMKMSKRMDFSFYKKTETSLYKNDRTITDCKVPLKADSITAKSSNSGVITIKEVKNEGNGRCTLSVKLNGAGNAKIKVYAVVNGKKKVVQTATVKVHNYTNPISSLTIGEKEYASQLNEMPLITGAGLPVGEYKINCKPAEGWKIKKIHYNVETIQNDVAQVSMKVIKNAGTVKLKEDQKANLYIEMYHPIWKMTQSVSVTL